MSGGGWSYALFADGFCRQLEAFSFRGGRLRPVRFPSMMAVLTHPTHGTVLFDTGYTARFFPATRVLPYCFYRWLTPVTVDREMTAAAFLVRRGMVAEDLRHLVLSHFHADHMGGLRDFPNAVIHCSRSGFDSIDGRSGFAAVRHAYLPDLMPDDFRERAAFVEDRALIPLEECWQPFVEGRDLFGDGSLMVVELPGHATGQLGLAFRDDGGVPVFLVSDACWSRRAYRENRPPNLLGWFPQADRAAYLVTLEKLHRLHLGSPMVRIIPTHCDEV